ncbi:MAG: DUF2157 domain-containing protein [Burkholderiales bacterium]
MQALQQPATARRLRELYHAGILDADAFERALALAGITPDVAAWRRFLDWLLAGLGAVLVLAGIVYFFAYNWAALHRFAKFGLVEAALLGAVALAWRLGPDSRGGRAALLGAAVLPGVLLALYGQTYQTGADSYELFLTWGMLITPWVIIGHSAALWLLWLVLANLAVVRWLVSDDAFTFSLLLGWATVGIPVALNIAALAACELFAARRPWLSGRWMPRVVALMVLGNLTPWMVTWIFHRYTLLVPFVWFGVTAFGVWVYRTWRRDLFMLAALALQAIVVVTAFVGHGVFEYGWLDIGSGLLSLGLLVMLMTGAAVSWLRRTARRWGEGV